MESISCLTIANEFNNGCLAFAPDGYTLAGSGINKSLRIWNARDGKTIDVFEPIATTIVQLAWVPHSDLLLAGDHSVFFVFQYRDEVLTLLRTVQAHWGWLYGLRTSSDGRMFITVGLDQIVKYWNLESDMPLFESKKFKKHIRCMAWHPLLPTCALATGISITLWDVQNRCEVQVLKGHTKTISTMVVSDDGQILASAGQDRTIRFWNAHDGTELAVIKGLNAWVEGIAFLPDSHVLVSGEDKGEIHFWDADSQREVLPSLQYIPEMISDHPYGITNIAVSSTKSEIHLAAGGYGNRLQIWKL